MFEWALDKKMAVTLYLGFAACGQGPELLPCDPSPDPIVGAPRITSISPTSGPPGTVVTITGTGFLQIDERYEAAYGDFAKGCDYGTMDGAVLSDTEIEVIVPEQASLPGFVYLLADGLTVARSAQRFELEGTAFVTVHNRSQFPIVVAEANWEPIMDPGDRIDVDDTVTLEVPTDSVRVELCVGDEDPSGEIEPWACVRRNMRLDPGEEETFGVEPIPAAQFLEGEWVATWQVSEEQTEQELLRIDGSGYWEIRHRGRVVEHGEVMQAEWPPYARDFQFGLRPGDPMSQALVPVNTFAIVSPRAEDRLSFYRAE